MSSLEKGWPVRRSSEATSAATPLSGTKLQLMTTKRSGSFGTGVGGLESESGEAGDTESEVEERPTRGGETERNRDGPGRAWTPGEPGWMERGGQDQARELQLQERGTRRRGESGGQPVWGGSRPRLRPRGPAARGPRPGDGERGYGRRRSARCAVSPRASEGRGGAETPRRRGERLPGLSWREPERREGRACRGRSRSMAGGALARRVGARCAQRLARRRSLCATGQHST